MTTNVSEYWDSVASIARDAFDHEKEGGDASDHIHESVDGSQHIIYTGRNLTVLQESRHADAGFDEMGDDCLSGCTSFSEVTARLAYWAMRADVDEALQELRDNAEEVAEEESADAES